MDAEAKARKWALMALVAALLILGGTLAWSSFRGETAPALNEIAGDETIEQLEDAVKANPQDGGAWARLGMTWFQRDEFAKAVPAFERATALQPDKAHLWSLLGEARFKAAGMAAMPPEAVANFQKALALYPGDPAARYYMAVAKDLSGDHAGAITDWLALLADTPAESPWEADLRQTIEQVGKINHIETASRLARVKPPTPPGADEGDPDIIVTGTRNGPPTPISALPGPDAQQVRDAARLSPSQQMEMGRGMVERLEGKLKADPSNLAGWEMLMRSRMQLNEPDKAKAALAAAIAANPGARARLEAAAKDLGVR